MAHANRPSLAFHMAYSAAPVKAAAGMKPGKLKENLATFAEQARLSQRLAELKADMDLGARLKDLALERFAGREGE